MTQEIQYVWCDECAVRQAEIDRLTALNDYHQDECFKHNVRADDAERQRDALLREREEGPWPCGCRSSRD